MKRYQWPYELITFLLALLFLYTGFSKLFDMHHFVKAMHRQPFSVGFRQLLIFAVPASELLTGFALLWIRTRIWGLYASVLLMLSFSAYVGMAIFHVFTKVPCGCAGIFAWITWPQHLVLNLVFLTLALIGTILHFKIQKTSLTALSRKAHLRYSMRVESGES